MRESHTSAYIRKPAATLTIPWPHRGVRPARVELRDRSRWSAFRCDLNVSKEQDDFVVGFVLHLPDQPPHRNGIVAFDDARFPDYVSRLATLQYQTLPAVALGIDRLLAQLLDRPPPTRYRLRDWNPVVPRSVIPVRFGAQRSIARNAQADVGVRDIVDALVRDRTPAYDSIRLYTYTP